MALWFEIPLENRRYVHLPRYLGDQIYGKDSWAYFRTAQFTSRPHLPLPGFEYCLTPPLINYGKIAAGIQVCDQPGISFVDDYADESFTVYDHPKVIIFKKLPPSLKTVYATDL